MAQAKALTDATRKRHKKEDSASFVLKKKDVIPTYSIFQHVSIIYYPRLDKNASGYTEVLQGGTISMPTGRHVDNLYYPRLDKNVGF